MLDEFTFDLLATGRKIVDQGIVNAGDLENPVSADRISKPSSIRAAESSA